MSNNHNISRRGFIKATSSALGLMAISSLPVTAATTDVTKQWNSKKKSSFTLWQIQSHFDTIGNSYVMRTNSGKVIVMDGGYDKEAFFLRGFLSALGNEVEAWFISHPHEDHMLALNEILKDTKDLRIKHIYHSKLSEPVMNAEPSKVYCMEFYDRLDTTTIPVTDIQQPGREFDFDGMHLKILSVANSFTHNAYNNSSMIMRVWDQKKSIVFLGDAGIECGDKVLNGPYRSDLDCEYMQMAHHGQNGCTKEFYDKVKFRACLWPTPSWVWNNDQGKGFNTGILKTVDTRNWMKEKGIVENHVSCLEPLYRLD